MCHVAPATADNSSANGVVEGSSIAAARRGVLVAVTSAGGVIVWGVPVLEGVGVGGKGGTENGAGAEMLDIPLLARHSVKVINYLLVLPSSCPNVFNSGLDGINTESQHKMENL